MVFAALTYPAVPVLQIACKHDAVASRFIFSRSPYEYRHSTGRSKKQNPLAGVFECHSIVELRGVEPRSKRGAHMLSTCLA